MVLPLPKRSQPVGLPADYPHGDRAARLFEVSEIAANEGLYEGGSSPPIGGHCAIQSELSRFPIGNEWIGQLALLNEVRDFKASAGLQFSQQNQASGRLLLCYGGRNWTKDFEFL